MLKVLVALIIVALVVIGAAALAGTAVQPGPAQFGANQGPERAALRLVP